MEGFETEKLRSVLRLPLSYEPVALLAVGYARGLGKYNGGRFSFERTVFEEEFPKPLRT